jgi:hypothetical protein
VYSERAVAQIRADNGSKVVCPKTGATFSADELRRAFVL